MRNAVPVPVNRILNSVYTLALMTGLYPALFFISNNWFVIGIAQSFYLLTTLTLAAFLSISLSYIVLSRVRSLTLARIHGFDEQDRKLSKALVRSLLLFLSCYVLVGYLKLTLMELEIGIGSIDSQNIILIAAGAILSVHLLGAWKNKTPWFNPIRPFNLLLLMMTALAFGNLAFSVLTNYDKIFGKITAEGEKTAEIYAGIQFKSMPNIYLIVPDSYPSNPLLKKFFNFDNIEFSAELERSGFRIYDNYFSSYPYSVESMHSMFSMTHNYFDKSIGNDAIKLREVIAGRGNNVINVLRNNGYKSVYAHETDYLLKKNCFIEACLPRLSEYERLQKNLKHFSFFNFPAINRAYNVRTAMHNEIERTKEGSRTFVYKHFMDAHSGLKNYEKRYASRLNEFRKHYPKKIEDANKTLLDEVRQITAQDRTAIIIIVADHGTWAGAERTGAGLTGNEILDKLNVFLAIRWGSDYNGEYDNDIKTSVNLFRYIFAFLSQSERILETRVPDDGYLRYGGVWKVVASGKVLEQPERHHPTR
jgi:hypothetical protein